ncbi:MAG: NAD(P)-dependent oxidoreductase [Candidatus Roizmanbacteria bacterium]|nr:NAD(P)-dependent oxidoreductase [Candidatus Roizmanbacteria bacterium]
MQNIAVVGARGYVGHALHSELLRHKDIKVTAVTRENYRDTKEDPFDILINCSMPSARFWAKNNPEKDYVETVEKTAQLLYGWNFKKFVQISSISARSQLNTVYGRHKAAAELLIDPAQHLIVRLGPIYSSELSKGVLVDIREGKKVFVDGASRYCFAPLEFNTQWIATHLDRRGIIEVGAHNAVTLQELASTLGVEASFEGELDHQEVLSPEIDFPDARDVFGFMDKWGKQL